VGVRLAVGVKLGVGVRVAVEVKVAVGVEVWLGVRVGEAGEGVLEGMLAATGITPGRLQAARRGMIRRKSQVLYMKDIPTGRE
jgi:hypothetical protein